MSTIIREAWKNICRYSTVSIDTIGIILLVFVLVGSYLFLIVNVKQVIYRFKDKVEIIVFLEDNLESEEIESLQGKIKLFNNVQKIIYIDKKQAFKKFIKDPDIREQLALLDINPLPSSLEIKIKNKEYNAVLELAEDIEALSGIEEIKYAGNKVRRLDLLLKYIYFGGAVVSMFFWVIVSILLMYVAKITAFYMKKEISVQKYFGATNFFLEKIFVCEAVILGTITTTLGIGLLLGMYKVLKLKLKWIVFLNLEYLIVLCSIGILLAVISKIVAVRKCLK